MHVTPFKFLLELLPVNLISLLSTLSSSVITHYRFGSLACDVQYCTHEPMPIVLQSHFIFITARTYYQAQSCLRSPLDPVSPSVGSQGWVCRAGGGRGRLEWSGGPGRCRGGRGRGRVGRGRGGGVGPGVCAGRGSLRRAGGGRGRAVLVCRMGGGGGRGGRGRAV